MSSHSKGKLNWLQRNLPEGLVVDAGWLERHGVSRQLRRKYVMNGWLLSPARGAYSRPTPAKKGEPLPWQHLVLSLNTLLNQPVVVGGRTALELRAYERMQHPSCLSFATDTGYGPRRAGYSPFIRL